MNLLQYEIRNPLFDRVVEPRTPMNIKYDTNDEYTVRIATVRRAGQAIGNAWNNLHRRDHEMYRNVYVDGYGKLEFAAGFELYQRDDAEPICQFGIEYECANVFHDVNPKPLDIVIKDYERGRTHDGMLILRKFIQNDLYDAFTQHEKSSEMLWCREIGYESAEV